ncbi:MAG TPA: helix-turn-helix domain-containing protein [Microlunatus sp.]
MTDPAAQSPGGRPDIELDTATLRVLAHPMRVSVLRLLRQRGPSTATRLAAELGINPGAASYHLRRLAAGGLIVEDEERGTGRDRWWTAVHRQSIYDPAAAPVEQREVGRTYTHAVALAAIQRLRRAAEEIPRLPEEWAEVSTYADFTFRLTPDELDGLRAELLEVLHRYQQRQAAESGSSAGAIPVSLQVQAFPVPGEPDPGPRPE